MKLSRRALIFSASLGYLAVGSVSFAADASKDPLTYICEYNDKQGGTKGPNFRVELSNVVTNKFFKSAPHWPYEYEVAAKSLWQYEVQGKVRYDAGNAFTTSGGPIIFPVTGLLSPSEKNESKPMYNDYATLCLNHSLAPFTFKEFLFPPYYRTCAILVDIHLSKSVKSGIEIGILHGFAPIGPKTVGEFYKCRELHDRIYSGQTEFK